MSFFLRFAISPRAPTKISINPGLRCHFFSFDLRFLWLLVLWLLVLPRLFFVDFFFGVVQISLVVREAGSRPRRPRLDSGHARICFLVYSHAHRSPTDDFIQMISISDRSH